MRYYIADLHLFHFVVNDRMDKRGFKSNEEMNEYIIEKWNSKVRPCDEVVVLGDISFGKGKETNEVLERLNGKIYLIRGNHDGFILSDKRFNAERFEWVREYTELNDDGRKVVLCHYPIFCYNGQYRTDDKANPKTYMLYGHVHNTYDEYLMNKFIFETRESKRYVFGHEEKQNIPCNMINCFCMFSDYVPLTLDEWIEVDRERREKLRTLCEEEMQ